MDGLSKLGVRFHFRGEFIAVGEKLQYVGGYWELSGMPCPHAISCIFYKTNCLEDYVAPCYSIEHFKKTYEHCLEPVEGMQAWPVSDRPRPRAPGYVKMPGRPKKARNREQGEKPRTTRVSKVGTRIRCSKCKGSGHNKSSCNRRHGVTSEPGGFSGSQHNTGSAPAPNATPSAPAPNTTPSAMPDAMVVVHGSQLSATSGTKRNNEVASATISVSTKRQKYSSGNSTARVTKEKVVKTTATARIKTLQGGSGTLSLEANIPTSQASSKVTVQVTSGHASAEVMAQEPGRKKLTPRRARPLPRLLLSPDK